jgi:probable rRNA maturation factor
MSPARKPYAVDVAIEHASFPVDRRRMAQAVRNVLRGEGTMAAAISVAVVSDGTIHELNRRFLRHDYPTDVLSFVLERRPDFLEGEIVVSADTAARAAPDYGWPPADELLLYVIHGALHLTGRDDHSPQERATMRGLERQYLEQLGVALR